MSAGSGERLCRVGDIELCYETFGDAAAQPMLLIMGLGVQMIGWHEDFCAGLVERGFFVVRYDNRDAGRSTRLERAVSLTPFELLTRHPRRVAYTLADMAGDAAGLLDALEIGAAHVVGASMGGMIAQTLAARHPGRTLSLASLMANTGSLRSGQPSPRVWPFFLGPRPPTGRQTYVEGGVRLFGVIGSPGFSRDEAALCELLARSYDRGVSAAATARQLAAVLASGNRTSELRTIAAPTVVIHGDADRLVAPSGGRATARTIPGARLVVIPGMGHDLPRGAWPRILDAIADNAARAQTPARASRTA
jgi:pimeloyl-ACP methyl ester carboxylesterase